MALNTGLASDMCLAETCMRTSGAFWEVLIGLAEPVSRLGEGRCWIKCLTYSIWISSEQALGPPRALHPLEEHLGG